MLTSRVVKFPDYFESVLSLRDCLQSVDDYTRSSLGKLGDGMFTLPVKYVSAHRPLRVFAVYKSLPFPLLLIFTFPSS